jgi:predicted RNase H-like HicB family nuclease
MSKEVFYPVVIYRVDEENEPYFIAYLPDFGEAACSAVGETEEEALLELKNVRHDVIEYYKKNERELPKPFSKKDIHFGWRH